MKHYKVKYKLPSQIFWRTIKDVKGDTDQGFMNGTHVMLIRSDESMLVLPREGLQIEFSTARHMAILQKMELELGQKIPLNT